MKIKYKIILLMLLFFAFVLHAYSAAGLKITGSESVTVFGEPPYILLSYEYPQDFKKSGEEILVNGRQAFVVPGGGGYGGRMTSETWIVYVGPPGKKHLKVTVRSDHQVLSATRTMDFRSQGDILLLDRTDGDAILSSGGPGRWPTEFHFFGYFFKDLQMELNGNKLEFHLEPLKVSADHFQISCRPELRQGDNTLVLNWKSADGKPRSKQYHFYLAKNGVVKQGDSITVRLGRLGSKSGPFYHAVVKGDCLQIEKGARLAKQVSLRKGFYLSQDLIARAIFKAQKPGKGVIGVYKKAVFFEPAELDRRIEVTIVK